MTTPDNAPQPVLRPHAEELFAEELDALVASDDGDKPSGWRMSPKAVLTYILGGEAKGKKIKGETYLKTYVLVKEGKDAAAIAAERQLSVGTIHGHFAKGVGEGVLDIREVMDDATRDTIGNWMRENADKGTNDARARFGETYSYGQLRIVQAWLKLEEGS